MTDAELAELMSPLSPDEQRAFAQLSQRTPAEQRAFDIYADQQASTTLAGFMRAAWKIVEPATPLVWGWHIDAMCEHLEAVLDGRIRNLAIQIPPGSSKSLTVNVFFPAWAWTIKPGTKFLCAANSGELITRDSVSCRRLIESPWYRNRWGHVYELTSDQNVKLVFENSKRGRRESTTCGSRATGRKGEILLCDDPHDTSEVESDAKRMAVISWWDRTFFNRVTNAITGRRIMIGQRTAFNDLPGHILERGGFEVLRIPEEFEAANPCTTCIGWSDPRTKEGELLRPERFGPAQVVEAKETLGSMAYAAQHQQRPVPESGGIFKSAWLSHRYEMRSEETYQLGTRLVSLSECRRFGTMDLAVSTKTSADYTVLAVWGDDRAGNLLLLDLYRGRIEGPDICPLIAEMTEDWGLSFVSVEAVGFQLSIVQQALRQGLPVRALVADKDKVSRALAATPMFEAGKVWLPPDSPDRPWLPHYIEELLVFPNGRNDDMVDCTSYATAEARRLYKSIGAPPNLAASALPAWAGNLNPSAPANSPRYQGWHRR